MCGITPRIKTHAEEDAAYDAQLAVEKARVVTSIDQAIAVARSQDYAVAQGSQTYTVAVPPTGIDATLAERGNRYGEFRDQAVFADGIINVMMKSKHWHLMHPDQREALRVIANKIGRICNGDPDYSDSWHDIAGYATLVDKRLCEK
jgi:hypothetical protein